MQDLVDKHFAHRGHGPEFEMEARWIRDLLPPRGGRVLDVGCGIGALFSCFSDSEVVGIDCNAGGLRLTRERFPSARLSAGDAVRLPFAAASFDVATTQHVIEHLPDNLAACREWHRVLRPEGMLLVLTPNGRFRDPSVYDDPTHVRIYQADDLDHCLRRTGFDVLDLRSLGLPWFRAYHGIPGAWRLRRAVTNHAHALSTLPGLRWAGQTLCCAARRPDR